MNCEMMRVISSPSSSTTGLATLILATLDSSGGGLGLVSDLSTLLWPTTMTFVSVTTANDRCQPGLIGTLRGDGVVVGSRRWGGGVRRGHLLVAAVVAHPRHPDL